MLPSMRYSTKKITELYHQRKSFQEHRRSISNIKSKQSKSPILRTKELQYMRDRMHSAFNYTQTVKFNSIKKDNLRLYQKCFTGRNTMREGSVMREGNPEDYEHQNQLSQLALKSQQKKEISKSSDLLSHQNFLLKSHRNSPINKLTTYERSRQNLRLAIKLSQPCPVINTKKLQKIHEEAKRHKQRIMQYTSSNLKVSKYLDKKISSLSYRSKQQPSIIKSSASSIKQLKNIEKDDGKGKSKNVDDHSNSNSSFNGNKAKSIYSNLNTKLKVKAGQRQPQIKPSIFRNRKNVSQIYTFSLTEYQPA